LLTSLQKQIELWRAEGCEIIIAGDFNENILSTNLTEFFHNLDMTEVVSDQHGDKPPNTMIQGSQPIDGIFATEGVTPSNSGYLPFDWGIASDHRAIWIDIPLAQLLGTSNAPLWKPQARRLKCEDPTLIREFTKLRLEYLHKASGLTKWKDIKSRNNLQKEADWPLLIKELDQIRTESIQFADKHCRKLNMGEVPWSPEIQKTMNNISYLQRCRLRYVNGYNINSRTLYKCFQKTSYTEPLTQPEEIISRLKEEFKIYNQQKKQAGQMRVQFLEKLAQSKSEVTGQTKEKIYRQLLLQETIRQMHR
jgi:hypothetical protein